jgi:hypothetical protein
MSRQLNRLADGKTLYLVEFDQGLHSCSQAQIFFQKGRERKRVSLNIKMKIHTHRPGLCFYSGF